MHLWKAFTLVKGVIPTVLAFTCLHRVEKLEKDIYKRLYPGLSTLYHKGKKRSPGVGFKMMEYF